MNCKLKKAGVTLTEMLIVLAVVMLLISIVIRLAARIDNQAKERLARGTISLLAAALEQFDDYGYQYKHNSALPYSSGEEEFYFGLDFPPDCNNYFFSGDPDGFDVQITLRKTLDAEVVSILSGTPEPEYSGSAVLYFFLSQVPTSKKTIEKIDSSLITKKDSSGQDMDILITFLSSSKQYPLYRIIDPWGTELKYDYYDEWADFFVTGIYVRENSKRNFPVIISAGPDRTFDTSDDITNR